MSFTELTPAELLSLPLRAPEINDGGWCVRWDTLSGPEVEQLVREAFPSYVDFATSGTTGEPQWWRCTRDQLWDEAALLAGLVGSPEPEGVLSFAPPRHRYGALASVLLPARLGVPVWTTPKGSDSLPTRAGGSSWVVVAIPWAFTLLGRRLDWVRAGESLSILHSTASLPRAAEDLYQAAGGGISIVEVFGSTESGAVASRRWRPGSSVWTLVPGVRFASTEGADGPEAPLAVRSPMIARRGDDPPPDTWVLDDVVRRLGSREFAFEGRRGRLVKVNGRRYDLDRLEYVLRDSVRCRDLACVPVTEPVIGEHFDLHIVPHDSVGFPVEELRRAVALVGVAPRKVRLVQSIERSATGKLRRLTRTDGRGLPPAPAPRSTSR